MMSLDKKLFVASLKDGNRLILHNPEVLEVINQVYQQLKEKNIEN